MALTVRFLYTTLFYLLVPIVILRLVWRGRKAPAYRDRWGERFGFVRAIPSDQQVVWVHSVSVGETLAAVPMIKQLQLHYSNAVLVVTTMTPTGSARVMSVFGDSVYHVYAPYDLPCALNRFLTRIHPDILVIMETELWPNLIHYCHSRGIPTIIANARLSEKSATGYQRFRKITAPMLDKISCVAAQHHDDGERFLKLGLKPSQLSVTGNIKFDINVDAPSRAKAELLKHEWRGESKRPIFLVASTHRGEDEILLDSYEIIRVHYPRLLLVLVPRHPERFDEVARLCEDRHLNLARRSTGMTLLAEHQVLLGDTMGELLIFFGACDIAFVGGSLVPIGGHNLIEPAVWSVPVLSGPQVFNFSEAARLLRENKALAICGSAVAIAEQVIALLQDEATATRMGCAAKAVVESNSGALERLLTLIEHQLS